MRYLLVMTMLITVGCMSIDPYTGQQKTSNTAKGAGIGALTGALIGAATASKKDRKKGMLTGAVAGGALGGGAGYYMDRQEAALRSSLEGTGVRVRREGNNIQLVMPGNITFATGQSTIKGGFYETLNSVVMVLNEFDQTAIKINGHTDSTGSADLNQRLSEDRANSVKNYLLNQNVVFGRVHATGYGFRYPIASNDTAAGRQANRRVELELQPLQ
jgi:outer membrane protein OmpA-like peptidoglycan-associated protein